VTPHATDRRRLIKDSTVYLVAGFVGQGFGLLRSIITSILFAPAQLGVWNLMNVLLSYGANAHLGLLHGMNRAIPGLRATGDEPGIVQMRDTVFYANAALGVLAALATLFFARHVPAMYGWVVGTTSCIVFLQLIFNYQFSVLRADERFSLVSAGVAGLACLGAIFITAFAWLDSDRLRGAMIGLLASYVVVVAFWFGAGGYRFRPRLSVAPLRAAMALGLPLILMGFLDVLFVSVDRWTIARAFSPDQLGYYAFGFMATSLLAVIPATVASVLYPRMLARYASTRDPAASRGLLLPPLRVISVMMVLVVAGAAVTLPPVVRAWLPKYTPSIPVIRMLLAPSLFLALGPFTGNYLVTVHRARLLIGVQLCATAASVVLNAIAARRGDIVAVAAATSLSYVVYGIGYTLFAVREATGSVRSALAFCAAIAAPVAVASAAIFAVGSTPSASGGALARWVYEVVVVVGPTALVAYLAHRRSGIFTMLGDELRGAIVRRRTGPVRASV
jgi:O-antigen/teichoic acid export membrane protein